MLKKKIALGLAAALVLTSAVGCSGGEKTEPAKEETKPAEQTEAAKEEAPAAEKALKVGMVTDVGGVNDESFNQSAWEGLVRAKDDLGIEVNYIESKQDADYQTNLETMIDSENDLIWGIGYKMGDALLDSAKQNPDQKYAIIDYSYGDSTPENIVGVVFHQEQCSFLVGYIAGKMTETNKVGFVGGMTGALIEQFEAGYKAGVKYANPNAEIASQYAESFSDAAKGKAIAQKMYNDGADIVFHAAGNVGSGVIEAANEMGKWAIGVDRDQNYLAPDHVLTSAMKLVGSGTYNITKDLMDGKWAGGTTVDYGVAEQGVGIAPTSPNHVPAEILEKVTNIESKIASGEIVVPLTNEEAEAFDATDAE
ncbi:MAG: BMP family ABC transporter substrate-binding protein [Tissierellales bacterium]|jgi:basic membrane protein A|nr:BMP family ABC transporter substrate-binding protein [Tissierellales bacterium]